MVGFQLGASEVQVQRPNHSATLSPAHRIFVSCLFACLFVTMGEGHSKPSFCNQRSKWQKWKSETFGSVGSTGVTGPMIANM